MKKKPDIHAKPNFEESTIQYQVLKTDDDVIKHLCRHITMGGAITDFCEGFKIDYFTLMKTIENNKAFRSDFKIAQSARNEYVKEKVTAELLNIVSTDITEAYSSGFDVKDIESLPKNIKRLISALETSQDGTKLKFQDKSKGLDILSKQQGMYVQKVELKADESLLGLLSQKEKKDL